MKFIFSILVIFSFQALSQDTLFLNSGLKYPFKDRKYSSSDNLNTSVLVKINNNFERRIINTNDIKYFLTKDTSMLINVIRSNDSLELSKFRYLDTNNVHISLKEFSGRILAVENAKCDTCKKDKIKTSIIVSIGPNINLGGQINSPILDNYQISTRNKYSIAAEVIVGKTNTLFLGAKCGFNIASLEIKSNDLYFPDYILDYNSFYFVIGPSYNFTLNKLNVAFKFYGGIISYQLEKKIKSLNQFRDFTSNGNTSVLVNPSLDFNFKLNKRLSLFNSIGLQIYNSEINAIKNSNIVNSTVQYYPVFKISNSIIDYRIGLKFDFK